MICSNTLWSYLSAAKLEDSLNLGSIFNRPAGNSFFETFFANALVFNWVYLFVWLLSIAYDFTSLLIDSFYTLNTLSTADFNTLKSFPVSYKGETLGVKSFWVLLGDTLKGTDINQIRGYFVVVCPFTIFNYFKGIFENHASYNLKDISEYTWINFGLKSNTFIVVFTFSLFVGSTLVSFIALSYLGLYGVFILNLVTIVFFWMASLYGSYAFLTEGYCANVSIGKWFTLWGYTTVNFDLYFDSLSYSYMFLTLSIAVFVYIYAFSYFRYEPNVERLLLFINLFVISMIILVLAGNTFVLFLGWELIGLTSFFLINFWSTRVGTLKSAFKAMTFNKFSDVCVLIYVLATFLVTHEHNIQTILLETTRYQNVTIKFWSFEVSFIELTCFFMLTAAFIKSAQFGVHIWLPDSMEAPVPASALIHSATLVSAGVFLILRFNVLFELSVYSKYIILYVGSFTAFFGGWCATYQSDVKKILAYSTLSHCGFLIASCAFKVPEVTLFYLYVHGFFKACVFLCVGNVIRFSNNYQDVRRMGMYWKYLPFEVFVTAICLFNLAGAPFSLGFFIKHALMSSLRHDNPSTIIIIFLLVTAAMSGIFYSARLFYYVFFDFKKSKKYTYTHYNSKDHKSVFFSTTTLGSNLAVTGLLVWGYIICLYMGFNLMSAYSIAEYSDLLLNESVTFYNYNWPYKSFLNLSALINWFFIQLFITLAVSTWRNTFSPSNIIDTFYVVTMCSLFAYMLTLIIA